MSKCYSVYFLPGKDFRTTLEQLDKHPVQEPHIDIDLQYADDISEITTSDEAFNETKNKLPKILTNRELKVNISKTEEYKIEREGSESWKQCKFLGTKLHSKVEISRRKGLAIDALNNMKKFFLNRRLSIDLKCRLFNSYISSIFLYNSEIWTLNVNDEKNYRFISKAYSS